LVTIRFVLPSLTFSIAAPNALCNTNNREFLSITGKIVYNGSRRSKDICRKKILYLDVAINLENRLGGDTGRVL
jgi:hypothetical protein